MQLDQVDDTATKLRQLAAVSLAKQREAQASCKGNVGCERVLQQVQYIFLHAADCQNLNLGGAGAQSLYATRGRCSGCLSRVLQCFLLLNSLRHDFAALAVVELRNGGALDGNCVNAAVCGPVRLRRSH